MPRARHRLSSHFNRPHHMKYLATTGLFVALLALLAAPALEAQSVGTHDNGVVQYDVYDDGNLGTHSPQFTGTGFVFMGAPGAALFASTVLVAQSETTVNGTAYLSGDFVVVSPVAAGTAPPPFDEAFETSFDDSGHPTPLGIVVHHTSYTSTTAGLTDFVVLDYMIENTSGGALNGVYVGNFSDWDVDTAVNNQACFDVPSQTLYVFAEGGATPFHYGVSPGVDPASGWDADGSAGNPTDANVWAAMTNGAGTCSTVQGDRRVTIGQGPFDIPNGGSQRVQFCVGAGEDLADLSQNMLDCQAALVVAIEPGPDGLPGTHNLSTVYPNPFNPQANFTLEVAEQQNVRIAVYDALGREVATLFNGSLNAGTEHAFTIDGADLPSGIYMVRAIGEQFTDVRQVTLMK